MKKYRRTKEREHFSILSRLANHESLKRIEFERPKTHRSFTEENHKPSEDVIPHSSLIDRLTELKKMEAVWESDSGEKSKKNITMNEYTLTPIGLIKLFGMCTGKELLPLDFHMKWSLPYIFMYVKFLQSMFSEKQLFEALIQVCKNIEIDIEYNPLLLYDKNTKSYLTKEDMSEGKKAVKMYHIYVKIKHSQFSFVLSKHVKSYQYELGKNKFRFRDSEALNAIIVMTACAFYHELIMRCQNPEFQIPGFTFGKARLYVIDVLRDNADLWNFYLDMLDEIEDYVEQEKKDVAYVKKLLIRRKKMARKAKKFAMYPLLPSNTFFKYLEDHPIQSDPLSVLEDVLF